MKKILFFVFALFLSSCASGPPDTHEEAYRDIQLLYPDATIYGNPTDERSSNYFVVEEDGSVTKISWNGFGDMFHYPYRDIEEIIDRDLLLKK